MSEREWKPGDVALATAEKRGVASIDGQTEHVAMRDCVGSWASGTTFGRRIDDSQVVDARPLVVIDPEDREQVNRLIELADKHAYPIGRIESVQAALREFANPTPPRPEEPTGKWAVVMDSAGHVWTRMNDVHWSSEASPNNRQTWGEINVVRVLSEGVSDD